MQLHNTRELATVLAALRYWQECKAHAMKDRWIRGTATDGGNVRPLDVAEIDALCERLNAAPTLPESPRVDPREEKVRAKGWKFGGDAPGFWFHEPTWGSWKAAASWEHSDNEPRGRKARPRTYATLDALCERERIK